MFNVKTLIAFVLGIAFMFIGCSDVKNPTATLNPASAVMPGDDNSNSVKEAVLLESLEEQIPTQVISIIGTVHFIQERDGCIYLQPSIGEFPHELNFRFSNCPSDGLRENSAVKVIGRFNPNSYSNCVGGSVFQVHDYVYLKYDPDNDNSNSDRISKNRQSHQAVKKYETINLTDKTSVAMVKMEVGQNLIISLNDNPSTGYRWDIVEVDESILPLLTRDYKQREAKPGMYGVGGTLTLGFKAIAAGQTKVKLIYARPFCQDDIANTFSVAVEVK